MKQVFGLASHPEAREGLGRWESALWLFFSFFSLSLLWNWASHILQESITSNVVFCKRSSLERFYRIMEQLRLGRKIAGRLDQTLHKAGPAAFVIVIATHEVAGESNWMHPSPELSFPGWTNAVLSVSCAPALVCLGYSMFMSVLTAVLQR